MNSVFISMIGLEKRVLGALETIELRSINKFLFFINDEFKEDKNVKKYYSKISSLTKEMDCSILNSSYNNSLKLVKQFNEYVFSSNKNISEAQVLLDISTFNRQNLLTILYLLRKKHKVGNITCYYTIPKETNREISLFAQHAATIPFFAGEQSIDKNKLLILLVGFEYDRALYLWEKAEPSKTLICIGNKPTDDKFYEINLEVAKKLERSINNCEIVDISANDPFQAQNDLEALIKKFQDDYNIIISPMNTKLQTLGLYLTWENFPSVQLMYSRPESFGDWLTKGIRKTEQYTLKL
jgi:hypothetical protein